MDQALVYAWYYCQDIVILFLKTFYFQKAQEFVEVVDGLDAKVVLLLEVDALWNKFCGLTINDLEFARIYDYTIRYINAYIFEEM